MNQFVLRHALPGVAGTGLVAVGSLGIGWAPPTSNLVSFPLVDVLRSTLVGSLASRAFVVIGLAIVLQAWLLLGSELLSSPRRSLPRVREILALLALWSMPLLLAPPMFSRDPFSYYVQGRVFNAGYDPTQVGIEVIPGWFDDGADPMWVESPTPYGPIFLMLERAVAVVAHPNAYLGALGFRLIAVAGVALIACFLPRLAAAHGIDPRRALWIGVLNPLILMHFISGSHNDALMVGLLVAGLALASASRCVWGAVAVSLTVMVKPIAVLVLPFIGLLWAGRNARWPHRIRSWLLTALVFACTAASAFLLANAGFGVVTSAFGTPSGVLTWLSPTTAIGRLVGMITTGLGITDDEGTALLIVRTTGLVVAIAIALWLILRPAGRSPVRGAALALGAFVLLGPVVQPWYLLWFLPLFAATGLTRRELQVVVILTAGFTVHGMIESSTNADNLADAADVMTYAVAALVVLVILLASARERRLVLGTDDEAALAPQTQSQRERAASMSWPARIGS